MRSITFAVVGIAQPKGSARAFVPLKWAREAVQRGREPRAIITSDNPKSKGWQQLVAERAQTVAGGELFLGGVSLVVTFTLPRPVSLPKRVRLHTKQPDLDKLLRSTIDGMNGIVFRDDAQVVEIEARKVYTFGAEPPGAVITVAEAGPSALEGELLPELGIVQRPRP
jgi:Holliday junction resolvase RusA-like endonuclease